MKANLAKSFKNSYQFDLTKNDIKITFSLILRLAPEDEYIIGPREEPTLTLLNEHWLLIIY